MGGWMGLHFWSKVLERHITVFCAQQAGQGGSLCFLEERETVTGGVDIWLAHWLPGKPTEQQAPHCHPSEGQAPHCPLKRTVRKLSHVRRVRWSGRVSRGCTESERAAILSGLTITLQHTLHDPYSFSMPPFCDIPGLRYIDGHWNQILQIQYRQLPLVSTNPGPPQEERWAPALREAFWWPSQESAVTGHVCCSMLCWVPLGVGPLSVCIEKNSPTGWTCVSKSQPSPFNTGQLRVARRWSVAQWRSQTRVLPMRRCGLESSSCTWPTAIEL